MKSTVLMTAVIFYIKERPAFLPLIVKKGLIKIVAVDPTITLSSLRKNWHCKL
jgi:hypothetical protein